MSGELILSGRQPKRGRARKPTDNATIGELFEICEGMVGPIAIIVQEMMAKIARLEDRAGITDETIAGEAPLRGTTYGETGLAVAVPPEVTVGPQFGGAELPRQSDL